MRFIPVGIDMKYSLLKTSSIERERERSSNEQFLMKVTAPLWMADFIENLKKEKTFSLFRSAV